MDQYPTSSDKMMISRRTFITGLMGAAGVAALGGCAQDETAPPPETTPAVTDGPLPEATPEAPEKYVVHNDITATVFWIGESASANNAYITNEVIAWDEDPITRFGGKDDLNAPRDANGVITTFTPRHNPYSFALPASEFSETGPVPGAQESSPWASEVPSLSDDESLFKGRWIAVSREGYDPVYCQWIDVGPSDEDTPDDYGYVFGTGQPTNNFNLAAGLDLSPAAAIKLGFNDGGVSVSWNFVDTENVPDGPWSNYPPIDNKTHWS